MGMMPSQKQRPKLLQNAVVASVVSKGLTAVTGTPKSPQQLMQAGVLAQMSLKKNSMQNKKGPGKDQEKNSRGPQKHPRNHV